MNTSFRNALFMLAAGTLAVSCADYNETDNFTAQPDPTIVQPYNDLDPVKSYINREMYPNMSIGATLDVKEFNNQALEHAAAVTNFNDLYFGTSLMSGKIINSKGVMNFIDMKALVDHVEEIGGTVYGSALAANSGQADSWLNLLTSPVEKYVEFQELLTLDFSKNDPFTGTGGSIVKYKGENVLQIPASKTCTVVDGFNIEPKAKYTTQFWVKSDNVASFSVVFSGTAIDGPVKGKYSVEGGGDWTRIAFEAEGAEGVENGYLTIQTTRGSVLNVKKVQIGYMPDNHRDQTPEEINDTIHWAMKAWCDGFMKNNAGRIKSFDLIEEPIGTKMLEGSEILDLKHSTEKIYWQDILGSEKYASVVSEDAIEAFKKYSGNADELKFFIAESGLDDTQKFNSLMHWINIWKQNGAKIDGINAKVSLVFDEDDNSANEAAFNKLLDNLKSSGLLVRISNFDIKYQAGGANVVAKEITTEQRQKLADYHATLIKKYLSVIDADKQAGICKASIVDTNDPVGLWAKDAKTNDWVRTATYKAFCDALSGK